MRVDWLADVLRAAGVNIHEHPGWKDRGNGDLDTVDAVTWHHDGSPPGASPHVASYITGQIDKGRAGANVWVGLDGTWHLLAAGLTFHAGRVRHGKPGNDRSIGVETDHTTGETWSGVELLASLRKGTAAIFAHLGYDADALEFHKSVCSPPGRKSDPDGLDLDVERDAVNLLLTPTAYQGDLLMPVAKDDDDARRCLIRQWCWQFWLQAPSAAEQQFLLAIFRDRGADLTLAEITDHAKARRRTA